MKQTAVSHSNTEAEIKTLDAGIRMEDIPAMNLWKTNIYIFKYTFILHRQNGGDSQHVHQTHIQKHQEPFEYVPPNT